MARKIAKNWKPRARVLIAEAMTAMIEGLTTKNFDVASELITRRDAITDYFEEVLKSRGL